ncbi:MAG TPA: hypothetical protein EYP41_11485 [Anaerolineae bacterium]|nr:hypothetical protein [Anaerolineae bacterium]HIP72142.1 hypothetical protein [Anaerolineae bacterium]
MIIETCPWLTLNSMGGLSQLLKRLKISYKRGRDYIHIQLLCLPTYASWLNPIEKLWRWLKQDILHLHRLSDAWPELRQRVDQFLANFSHGSTELLRYVGLLPI